MRDRKLTISFGETHPANIVRVEHLTWATFAALLTHAPLETADKTAAGWYACAEFDPAYRDSENLVARHCLTFDYDHIARTDIDRIQKAYEQYDYAFYTTASHTAKNPRLRMVLPLSRPAGYDEFQAVSRAVAARSDIELASRESHVPAQMMYLPTVKPGAKFKGFVHTGVPVDVDEVLQSYRDWTDRTQWPKRKDGDGVHSHIGTQTPPDEKPGVVGDFCRAFDIYKAIERFELPYVPTATPGRWTYTAGSRPEGAIVYDDGRKLHSHHDTDPARGQTNSFDLVRFHRFASFDKGHESEPITQRPSYRAMCELAHEQPEVRTTLAEAEFEDLGPLVEEEVIVGKEQIVERFRVFPAEEFSDGRPVEWHVKGALPKAELAVIYGESGSGKSFLALDLGAAVTRGVNWREHRTSKGRVVYICAEGAGGFKSRMRAYAHQHKVDLKELPAVISDAPNMLDAKDAALITSQILKAGGADVVVIDTLSASFAGNENSGEDIGQVLRHCKFLHAKTGALIVLIHHSGKDAAKGARGWSGLRAAADAEIEVTRSGEFRAAKVTKMKDGTDGVQFPFRLEPVSIGFDEDHEEITSCVVKHTDEQQAAKARSPRGTNARLVYDALRALSTDGTPVAASDLISEAVKKKAHDPADGKRDQRRAHIRRALDELAEEQFVFLSADGASVSLIRGSVGNTEDFDHDEEYLN